MNIVVVPFFKPALGADTVSADYQTHLPVRQYRDGCSSTQLWDPGNVLGYPLQ